MVLDRVLRTHDGDPATALPAFTVRSSGTWRAVLTDRERIRLSALLRRSGLSNAHQCCACDAARLSFRCGVRGR